MSRVTVGVNDLPGGSETFLGSFARALVDQGHDVTLLALRPTGRAPVEVGQGVATAQGLPPLLSRSAPAAVARLARHHLDAVGQTIGRARRASSSLADATRRTALAAPILATEPDVVHFSFSGIAVTCEPVLDLLGDCRLVTSCRGSAELVRPAVDPERRAALGRVLPRLDAVHAVSSAMATTVIAHGARPESVRVIRPAVDLDRFAARAVVPADPGPLRLVTVGRLDPLKGHGDLISALALLRRGGVDARLTIVGGGEHHGAFLARAHLLGQGDHVDLVGSLPPSGVTGALEEADVFVSASLSEGISNATLEAAAVGLPVVVTDVGGMGEVVDDEVNGLLVPPGDPGALAGALAGLADDATRRVELGRAGRARVAADFGLGRMRGEWAAFYSDLMADRPGAGPSAMEGGQP
ncbi:colanic acid biosynthesis glycosyltransferase WcaL [soil metagenome]